jgi:guanylate kinase
MNQPNLKHYHEFNEVLENYHPSERAKKALEGLNLVLLVAPTSTGRNTVIRELVDKHNYQFIVSDTTRPPQFRDGRMEEDSIDYFFRTEDDMLADLRSGEFLEAALIHEQQVSGVSIRELEKAKNSNKIAITDIDPQGADNVMRAKPDSKAIFLIPPSFEEWQRRISSRGRMTEHELRNRLRAALKEFEAALVHNYYQYVITENVMHSATLIESIVRGKQNPHQGQALGLIHRLQGALNQKLSTSPV